MVEQSILTISPSFSTSSLQGMPWQITSLMDVHTLFGKPPYPRSAGRAAVFDGVIVNPLVDFFGGHARRNALGYHVEHAHVDGCACFDGLDVSGAFQNVARGNLVALVIELLQALIGLPMALLVLLAAAAPAFVVRPGWPRRRTLRSSFRSGGRDRPPKIVSDIVALISGVVIAERKPRETSDEFFISPQSASAR